MSSARDASKSPPAASAHGVSTGEVRDALGRLQSAARDVLAEVSGLAGSRPVDLVASLGIDLKLAWKVSHIAQSGDPFGIVRHLPGAVGWKIWLEAARAKGAGRAALERAIAQFESVQRIGEAWAGHRRNFAALSASVLESGDRRFEVEHRRQLFEGGAYVWGVRADVALRLDVLAPSGRGRTVDCATARGFLNLERLRPDATWRFEPPAVIDDAGTRRRVPRMDRLDDRDADAAPPFLLKDFCSSPLPGLRAVSPRTGERFLELEEGAVGLESRATLMQGAILRGVQPTRVGKRDHGFFQLAKLRTPVAELVFDLLVHDDLLGADPHPEAVVYSDLNGSPDVRVPYGPRDRIPCVAEVEPLGSGTRKLRLAELANYGDLVRTLFDRCGWEPDRFQAFRLRLAYPPIPSTIALELPFEH